MAQQIGEDTKITLDPNNRYAIVLGALTSMWFALQAHRRSKRAAYSTRPDITRMEFDMKDQLVRQTIMTTEDIRDEGDIKRIEEKIDNQR